MSYLPLWWHRQQNKSVYYIIIVYGRFTSYLLFTKLNSCSILHSARHEVVNDCLTSCYCGSLHFRNTCSQRNELSISKCWRSEFLNTISSVLYTCISIDCTHSSPWIMDLSYQIFWESTNENANLSLGTGTGFSYSAHPVIKPKTYSFWCKTLFVCLLSWIIKITDSMLLNYFKHVRLWYDSASQVSSVI